MPETTMADEPRFRISDYLGSHNTLTLATSNDNRPWACSVFYCHDDTLSLYFISDPQTRHCKDIQNNPVISATINEDVRSWSDIQGLQIDGRAEKIANAERRNVEELYLAKFADLKTLFSTATSGNVGKIYQRFQSSTFYRIEPVWIRFIDNSRGFGFKEEMSVG